jgi:hypothetical protein
MQSVTYNFSPGKSEIEIPDTAAGHYTGSTGPRVTSETELCNRVSSTIASYMGPRIQITALKPYILIGVCVVFLIRGQHIKVFITY